MLYVYIHFMIHTSKINSSRSKFPFGRAHTMCCNILGHILSCISFHRSILRFIWDFIFVFESQLNERYVWNCLITYLGLFPVETIGGLLVFSHVYGWMFYGLIGCVENVSKFMSIIPTLKNQFEEMTKTLVTITWRNMLQWSSKFQKVL